MLGLGYIGLLIIAINTKQWFHADEWEVIVSRDRPPLTHVGDLLDVLFRPHNEHWITIPVILYRAVFAVVGLREYWPYLVAHLGVHVLLGWMLVRRLRTEHVHRGVILAGLALFLFYGPGFENILWAFQFVFMASVIFGLAWLELLDKSDSSSSKRHVRLGWLCGIGALACSGIGLTVVFIVGLRTLIVSGWRRALTIVSVPVVAHALWYVTYGHTGAEATHIDSARVAQESIPYIWSSLTAMVDQTVGVDGLGPVTLVVLIGATVATWAEMVRRHHVALAMAAGALFLPAIVAVGRVQFADPGASRYLYLEFVLLLPLIGVHLTRLLALAANVNRQRQTGAALGALFVVSAITCVGLLIHRASDEGKRESQARDQVTAAFALARSSFWSPMSFPEPGTLDLRMADVRRLLDRGIQPWGQPSIEALALVTARTTVDVSGKPRVPLAANAITIASLGRANASAAETGCVALTPDGADPQVGLLLHKRASVKFVPQSPGQLLIFVRRGEFAAAPVIVAVAGNNPVFLNFVDPTATYIVQFPPVGISKLCGAGQEIPVN